MAEEKIQANLVNDQQPINSNIDFDEVIYKEEEVNMKDFVIGAFVGGIVGAAVGLLLAPKAGKDLRSDVATQAVNLKDKSLQLSEVAKEKGSQITEVAKEKTIRLSNQIKEQSTQIVDKVKSKTSKVPQVFDDGTVSFEGEEPLEDVEGVVEDFSEIARPSSIE